MNVRHSKSQCSPLKARLYNNTAYNILLRNRPIKYSYETAQSPVIIIKQPTTQTTLTGTLDSAVGAFRTDLFCISCIYWNGGVEAVYVGETNWVYVGETNWRGKKPDGLASPLRFTCGTHIRKVYSLRLKILQCVLNFLRTKLLFLSRHVHLLKHTAVAFFIIMKTSSIFL